MEDKDLNYCYYHKELVDAAKAFAETFYKENHFISDIKCLELSEKLPETAEKHKKDMQNLIYKQMLERFESAYLYGMQYAVANDIGSTKPAHDSQLCQYQKDKDFAFVFKFGDNDFGNYFEHAAKLYCNAYNEIIDRISIYQDSPIGLKNALKDINALEKQETIIEILKMGIASYNFQNNVNTHHLSTISFEDAIKDTKRYTNDYFDFNGSLKIYEKNENGEYIVIGTKPRLIIGTRAEIETELLHYGHLDEESSLPREFPVWCNGEALIIYMKNGFLTYVIR
jgi:hypothetical protein